MYRSEKIASIHKYQNRTVVLCLLNSWGSFGTLQDSKNEIRYFCRSKFTHLDFGEKQSKKDE